ncbi:hypothetical protein D3C76_1613550 [compost metagenome]
MRSNKRNFIAFVNDNVHVIQNLLAFNRFGEAIDRKQLLACFTLCFEMQERIFTVRRTNIIQRNFIELLFT